MSKHEQRQLDSLIEIAGEDDCPMSEWEIEFVESLDRFRDREMSIKQADCFDKLVRKHLRSD